MTSGESVQARLNLQISMVVPSLILLVSWVPQLPPSILPPCKPIKGEPFGGSMEGGSWGTYDPSHMSHGQNSHLYSLQGTGY